MTEAVKKAKKTYEDKRTRKFISFNTESESALLNFANNVEFSTWVKQKIREELDRNEKPNS